MGFVQNDSEKAIFHALDGLPHGVRPNNGRLQNPKNDGVHLLLLGGVSNAPKG